MINGQAEGEVVAVEVGLGEAEGVPIGVEEGVGVGSGVSEGQRRMSPHPFEGL